MKVVEFDTGIVARNNGLNGMFDSFCPSNSIASKLNKKRQSVLAEKLEWDDKFKELENGQRASEWADLKGEVQRTQLLIDSERALLDQEKAISEALGLGAWCNGAVSKRKKAEASLSDAEKSLGEIKGAFEVLERQQKEGIERASEVIDSNNEVLRVLKLELSSIKAKIENHKAQRDAEKRAEDKQKMLEAQQVQKTGKIGFLKKENAPLIVGGVLLVGAVVYFSVKKNKKITKKVAV